MSGNDATGVLHRVPHAPGGSGKYCIPIPIEDRHLIVASPERLVALVTDKHAEISLVLIQSHSELRAALPGKSGLPQLSGRQDAGDLSALAVEGFRQLRDELRKVTSADDKKRFQDMAVAYVNFSIQKPAMLKLMFGRAIAKLSKEHELKQAAREAFLKLMQAAARAAGLSLESSEALHLAIASWSLVYGYSILLTNGALDFVEPGATAGHPRTHALCRSPSRINFMTIQRSAYCL